MRFEFDPGKSAANLAKHGIDFVEPQRLWDDPRLFIFVARTEEETRYLAVGQLGDRCWSAVYTPRRDRVRLISVRHARRLEIERYESQ
ncbi:BrnT family toxin [Aureimonas leprariae]|uniref:BrnT family toxin n=1 Tax=Plantimonas leprariae TaxID=2615207 RepID=A0A7V7TWK2_9HYPH|nr:BrnT family toxin [Aureimonas leprariae]KAB0679769.1 BrnT family toxin [Aureimonas leprariae]